MNWLERARCEFGENATPPTANSAERNLTAVTAVPTHAISSAHESSNVSNGSSLPGHFVPEIEGFEELHFDAWKKVTLHTANSAVRLAGASLFAPFAVAMVHVFRKCSQPFTVSSNAFDSLPHRYAKSSQPLV